MAEDDSAAAPSDNSADFVRSLARGLSVIKAFDRFTPAMTLSDVARKTGLPRAAAGRFLKTLVTLEYASFDGREYRLRPRVLELGMAYFSSFSFIDIANPILEAAAKKAGEPCSMGVLDGTELVYVARHTANRMMSISIALGNRYPATSTSLGRVLLGGLSDAELDALLDTVEIRPVTPQTVTDKRKLRDIIVQGRSDGYCTADGQLEIGIRSIAVPVRGRDGKIIAAINMGVPATRHTMESLTTHLLPILRDAASEIEFAIRSKP
ncbi:IclR family transcriptional regulator domain-containing protein [Microbaculum marinisediminis]|uniref:Helix-turn-helix domain-containing protein n=1 Tax=Microbaculum marinisediminis TaxID=2931392 RepID=A0AAW5R1S8_9HYPH|nr:IclR family transcriptional regulator C-terminal domain-containing protein [Microbaculum sp. A6E488]MCT8973779.1 helix-turn-helix domain-containing protein [Microbaculum sp. A6E488]